MRRTPLIIALFCCLTASTATKTVKPVVYIDRLGGRVEEWAARLCNNLKSTKYQLSRISSVSKLVDLFGGLGEHHELFGCRTKYLAALEQLVEVFESHKDDVCGEKKLKLIENFHRKYVSKVSKYRKRVNKAPKLAKLLFMRYATEISSVCEQNTLETLENNRDAFNRQNMTRVEELREFTDGLGMTDLSKGYRRIYLFWNMIDSLDLASQDKFSKFLGNLEDGVRINVQMRRADTIAGLQALCRHTLRPLYAQSLLPLLRLVDLGYYPKGDSLLDALSLENSHARTLFFSTQICETIEPIGVHPNDQLNEDEFVALPREEAARMTPLSFNAPTGQDVALNIVSRSFELDDLTLDNYATSEVKTNIAIRVRIINLLLRNLVKITKSKLKSFFKSLILLRKSENKGTKPFIREALDDIDAEHLLMIDEADEDHEQESEDGPTRRKRSLSRRFLLGPVYLVYYMLMEALKVAILLLPTMFFSLKDGLIPASLKKAWNYDPLKRWMLKET